MESSVLKIQLLFCKPCGLQRVCDVTKELQELFTAKHLEPNTCGICQKQVEPDKDVQIDLKKIDECGNQGQSEESDDDNENYRLDDDSCDKNDDNIHLSNERKEVIDTKKTITKKSLTKKTTTKKSFTKKATKHPTKAASKTAEVARQELPEKAAHQEPQKGTRVTRLRTGAITTRKYTNPQDDQFSTEDEKSEDESNSEESAKEDRDQDEDDVNVESDPDEPINKKVKKLMEMEEDPEMVALLPPSILEETDENPVRFLDPEIKELTLPPDDLEKSLKCKVCNAAFITVGSFVKHVSDHTGKGLMEKPLKCPDCGTHFSTNTFREHRKKHLKLERRQRCTYKGCRFVFNDKAVFQSHLAVHKGAKHHYCTRCGAGYSTKQDLSIHWPSHKKQNIFLCRYCKRPFNRRARAKEHERKIHKHEGKRHVELNTSGTTSEALDDIDLEEVTQYLDKRLLAFMDKARMRDKPFRCKQCPTKEFCSGVNFLNHLKYKHPQIDCPVTHAYACNQCDKKYKTINQLTDHNVSHSLLKPHMCDYDGCDKSYGTQNQLKQHKYTHKVNRRKHVCHICGKDLVQTSLRYHLKAVHSKSQPRPYKCTYCTKAYIQKSKRDMHIRLRHTNIRPFVCEVCGQAFKENHELVTHSYTHTGERPFACHLCEYRCIRRDYLRKHIRTHTREHPYKCELCEMTFMHKTNLNDHNKKVNSATASKSGASNTLTTMNETAGAVLNIPHGDGTATYIHPIEPMHNKEAYHAYETITVPLQDIEGMQYHMM